LRLSQPQTDNLGRSIQETVMKLLAASFALLCLPLSAQAAEGFTVAFKAQGAYEEARDLVQASTEGKGLKINHTNRIAGMLERTGKEIGATKQVYAHGDRFEAGGGAADPHRDGSGRADDLRHSAGG
jgi:hypothetical protein